MFSDEDMVTQVQGLVRAVRIWSSAFRIFYQAQASAGGVFVFPKTLVACKECASCKIAGSFEVGQGCFCRHQA